MLLSSLVEEVRLLTYCILRGMPISISPLSLCRLALSSFFFSLPGLIPFSDSEIILTTRWNFLIVYFCYRLIMLSFFFFGLFSALWGLNPHLYKASRLKTAFLERALLNPSLWGSFTVVIRVQSCRSLRQFVLLSCYFYLCKNGKCVHGCEELPI